MKDLIVMLLCIMCIGTYSAGAQHISLSGQVTAGKDQAPLSGVTVSVAGTNKGTITGEDGWYKILVPREASQLVFSFIGMKTLIRNIDGERIDAHLVPDFIGMDEVVVLGYLQKGRNELTGSAVQVDGSQIENIPVVSLEQTLQGKVPGLMVATTSGTPGSEQQLLIRGMGSITAGNQPLIVIDGVPVVNENFSGFDKSSSLGAMASLNQDDIKSITVLKDASATSAYGSRGSNGVIVITTRKGVPGKTRFNFYAATGIQNEAVEGITPLTGSQRAELLVEGVKNTFPQTSNFSRDQIAAYLKNNRKNDELGNWDGSENNWNDLIQNKNALYHDYNFSASGGDDVSSFYVSLGYNKAEATIKGGDFERWSSKLNFSREFTETVKFAADILISNVTQDAFLEQNFYRANPMIARYLMTPFAKPYLNDGKTFNTSTGSAIYNVLYLLENDHLQNNMTRGIGNVKLEWLISQKLKFSSQYAGDYIINAFHDYRNRIHGDYVVSKGSTQQSVARNFNQVTQNSIDYIQAVDDHSLSAKILFEYQVNRYNNLYGFGENLPADDLYYIASAGANYQASSIFADWKNVSYLGMINYNYRHKYIADLTYRYEGSSRFAPGHRFGNFWAIGAAWNLDQEDFLSQVDALDLFRLRASYGMTGNSQIGINRYQPLFSFDANYDEQGAFYPGQMGNQDLTWEKNKTFDIGLEYSFLEGRIKGSLSWYNKRTFDLLQDVPLSRTTGHSLIMMNVGEMVNHGIETLLESDLVRSKNFNLSIAANMATLNNEVTALAMDNNGFELGIETDKQKVAVSHPVYGWYMRRWAGVDPETGNPLWYKNESASETTDSYKDAEKVWLGGNPLPTYTGGFSLHAGYKGLFLDGTLYFAGGHKIYDENARIMMHSGNFSTVFYNGMAELMNRWQKPGDITDVPKRVYDVTGYNDDSNTSSRFLYDGDYMRLKNIALGYHLPSSWMDPAGMDDVSVSVRGANLLTWVKDDRLTQDPEVRTDGSVRITVPPVKSIIFGINFKF